MIVDVMKDRCYAYPYCYKCNPELKSHFTVSFCKCPCHMGASIVHYIGRKGEKTPGNKCYCQLKAKK